MGYQHLEIEIADSVGTIWLNRPDKLNALSEDMWVDIPEAVHALDEDESVRVIILAGRGPSFTVGIDIAMLTSFAAGGSSQAVSNENLYRTIRRLQTTASVFADSPKPVIASIHGYCLGAGMDLISACDIRLASSDATFSIRETKMGLVADIGTFQRLPQIIGAGHVAELAYTGDDIDAARALEINLVNHVLEDSEKLLEKTRQLAASIASNSPLVAAGIKNVLSFNKGRTVEESLDYVARWNAAHLLSNDLFEASTAFVERRPPEFTGT